MVTKNTIVIYHDLAKGGALTLLNNIKSELEKKKYKVTVLSPKTKTITRKGSSLKIFNYLLFVILKLTYENYKIAKKINGIDPIATIVFPSINTQAPSILFFLKKNTTFYYFTESKREFYEETSFYHNSLKKRISRLILLPIQILDLLATKYVSKIITISIYSQEQLLRIYNRRVVCVIRPGQKDIKPRIRHQKVGGNFISVGLFTKTKGHHFSIQQFQRSKFAKSKKLIIIGKNSHDSAQIKKYINNDNIIIKTNVNETEKNKLLKESYAYFANQENEPYGISTLEAANLGLLIIGKNSGGTPEIVQNGNNGILYPSNLKSAVKQLNRLYSIPKSYIYQTCIIDWSHTTSQLINIIQNR